MHHTLNLTKQHKDARVQWAQNHINWADEWLSIQFSDEKKFNLDSPNSCAYYWYNIQKEPQTFLIRQQGGGSLMVWEAFSYNETTDIVFLKGHQCSEDNQKMLKSQLLPFGKLLGGNKCIYQQDNGSSQTLQCNGLDKTK